MAWETRGTTQYLYRSRRINGQVRKIYLGSGIQAQQIWAMDHQRQVRREQERAFWKQIEALDIQTDTLRHTTRLFIKAHLLTHGYHQHHRGEWRKRRPTITAQGDSMPITALAAQDPPSLESLTSLVQSCNDWG